MVPFGTKRGDSSFEQSGASLGMKLNQVLQNIWFLGKLELSPRGCLPPHTNQVAVYTHVCPGSCNTCSDWCRALSHGATTWNTWSSVSAHHGAGGGVQWFKSGCRCEEARNSDAWILHTHTCQHRRSMRSAQCAATFVEISIWVAAVNSFNKPQWPWPLTCDHQYPVCLFSGPTGHVSYLKKFPPSAHEVLYP